MFYSIFIKVQVLLVFVSFLCFLKILDFLVLYYLLHLGYFQVHYSYFLVLLLFLLQCTIIYTTSFLNPTKDSYFVPVTSLHFVPSLFLACLFLFLSCFQFGYSFGYLFTTHTKNFFFLALLRLLIDCIHHLKILFLLVFL